MSLEDDFEHIRLNFIGRAGRDYAASRGEYLNGKRLRKPVVTYDDIKDGADLHFVMSGKPARKAFAE